MNKKVEFKVISQAMNQVMEQEQIKALMCTNQKTEKFGLSLTAEEAKLLVVERKNTLQEQQRIEFGKGILSSLIDTFCDSPYIYQDNYVATLTRLQEIFYLYKNESMEGLTDDELIQYMKENFDGVCQGDLDYLEGTQLDEFCRFVRANDRRIMGKNRVQAYKEANNNDGYEG